MNSPRKPSVLFVFYTHTEQSRRVADAMAGVAMVDTGVGQALAEEAAKAVGQEAIEKFGEGLVAEAHGAQGNPDGQRSSYSAASKGTAASKGQIDTSKKSNRIRNDRSRSD